MTCLDEGGGNIRLILESAYQYFNSGSCVSSTREVSLLLYTSLPLGNSLNTLVGKKKKI